MLREYETTERPFNPEAPVARPRNHVYLNNGNGRKSGITDLETLTELIEMDLETMDVEPRKARDIARVNKEVIESARSYEDAVNAVLLDYIQRNMEKFNLTGEAEGADEYWILLRLSELGGGASFLYYMEGGGHGIGTWDGRWDDVFKRESDLRQLSELMKSETSEAYQVLANAIMNCATDLMEEHGIGGAYEANAARKAPTYQIPGGPPVRIYDNGGETTDRFSVVIDRSDWNSQTRPGRKVILAVSDGGRSISEFTDGQEGSHLGRAIRFESLDGDTRAHIISRLKDDTDHQIDREFQEMGELLFRKGYDPELARVLIREGMGPEELRGRLQHRSGEIGSLEHSHGVQKRTGFRIPGGYIGNVAKKKATKKTPKRATPARRSVAAKSAKRSSWDSYYAQPYANAAGFYFSTLDEFEAGMKKLLRRGIEEVELQFIDGDSADADLFNELKISPVTLELWFDEVQPLEEYEKAGLYGLNDAGGKDIEEMIHQVKMENPIRHEGTVLDYARSYVDDVGIENMGESAHTYFGYEKFGESIKNDILTSSDDEEDMERVEGMSDRAVGEEYVDGVGWEGISKENLEEFFDYEYFARDLELGGDVSEMKFAGKTWVFDNLV
jgi:hypothetical protein